MNLPQTIIRFPEIELRTRDAHKMRGYFGNLFKEKSELLHNHLGNGEFRYAYPQVQYKVIEGTPMLVGLKDGAQLLNELFLKIRELNIDGKTIPVHQKNIEGKHITIGETIAPHQYRFETLWMAVNQKNHQRYEKTDSSEKRRELLERILTGNILSFFKSMDHFVEHRIQVQGIFTEKKTQFKNQTMLAFEGGFSVNVALPDFVGLGKQVSRGFGTIKQV
ncbi:MAG: CRISPR-associated endonuclease Cas6 [Balneolaceae bacterium]